MKKLLLSLAGLTLSASVFAGGGSPASNPIDDFSNSWTGKTLRLQSQIDRHSAISTNNILGSHNSYNSSEYADDGYPRYLDPQQKHTLKEQLRLGARFLELDVHWTINSSNWRYHLVLCHGQDSHLGCSLNDKFLTQGLQEVREWLQSSESNGQVIILYIEDHSENKHSAMYSQLNDKIGSWVYRSNGCNSVPANLTKDDVLDAGKKVIIWKDGRSSSANCSADNNLKNMVFTSLGSIDRIWEDRTIIGGIFGGDKDSIEVNDVRNYFALGRNIVNLDDMTHNDGRNAAAIWSWNTNEPNNSGNEDCALQLNNGRWADVGCGDNRVHPFSCTQPGTANWSISAVNGTYSSGASACAALGSSWKFAVPTNAKYNKIIRDAANAAGASRVWLNINDQASEGNWVTPEL